MKPLDRQIQEIQQRPHCVNCGLTDPKIVQYTDIEKGGLTQCCHEEICFRLHDYVFEDEGVRVEACCWAIAEKKFKLKGIAIHQLKGMRRRKVNEQGEGLT